MTTTTLPLPRAEIALRDRYERLLFGLRRRRVDEALRAVVDEARATDERVEELERLARLDIEPLITRTGLAVTLVPNPAGPGCVVVKVATDRASARELRAESRAVTALREDPAIAAWVRHIPVQVLRGLDRGRPWVIERSPSTTTCLHLERRLGSSDELLRGALAAIEEFQRLTSRATTLTPTLVEDIVASPLRSLAAAWPAWAGADVASRTLDEVEDVLCSAVSGVTAQVGWTHGDYWLNNILADPTDGTVVGVIDWGGASPTDLSGRDPTLLTLSTYSLAHGMDLNTLVGRLIAIYTAATAPTAAEARLMNDLENIWPSSQGITARQGLVLTWSAYAALMMRKRSGNILLPGSWVHLRFAQVVRTLREAGVRRLLAP